MALTACLILAKRCLQLANILCKGGVAGRDGAVPFLEQGNMLLQVSNYLQVARVCQVTKVNNNAVESHLGLGLRRWPSATGISSLYASKLDVCLQ